MKNSIKPVLKNKDHIKICNYSWHVNTFFSESNYIKII